MGFFFALILTDSRKVRHRGVRALLVWSQSIIAVSSVSASILAQRGTHRKGVHIRAVGPLFRISTKSISPCAQDLPASVKLASSTHQACSTRNTISLRRRELATCFSDRPRDLRNLSGDIDEVAKDHARIIYRVYRTRRDYRPGRIRGKDPPHVVDIVRSESSISTRSLFPWRLAEDDSRPVAHLLGISRPALRH